MNTSKPLYYVSRRNFENDYRVIRRSDGATVFIGTLKDCREWIERNGHDEWH